MVVAEVREERPEEPAATGAMAATACQVRQAAMGKAASILSVHGNLQVDLAGQAGPAEARAGPAEAAEVAVAADWEEVVEVAGAAPAGSS